MVERFYFKVGDPGCISFWDIVWKKTDKHNSSENPIHVTAVGMGNGKFIIWYD